MKYHRLSDITEIYFPTVLEAGNGRIENQLGGF